MDETSHPPPENVLRCGVVRGDIAVSSGWAVTVSLGHSGKSRY